MSQSVDDLVGLSYDIVGGCYGLARTVLGRLGQPVLPEAPEDALADPVAYGEMLAVGQAARAGDVVCMRGTDDFPMHVGVALDAFRVIHATRSTGVRIDRLDSLLRTGAVLQIARPKPMMAGSVSGTWRGVSLVEYSNLISRSGRTVSVIESKGTVREAVAAGRTGSKAVIVHNGRALAPNEDPAIRPGDTIIAAPAMGETTTIIMVAIAIASAAASALIAARVKMPIASDSGSGEQTRYGFSRFSNDAFAGDVIPVVFGSHRAWGGKVIAVIPSEADDGSGDNVVRMLICMGHGPFYRIGSFSADATAQDAAGVTGISLNDQPIANFPGCRVSVRMGSAGQRSIPGFDDIEVYREVGVGGVVLRNTSGAERTGSTASGEAYTFSTVNAVNGVRVRIRFLRGLFSTSGTGSVESASATWRLRTRTTDVGSGAGSWSAWTSVTASRSDQSEVISVKRVGSSGTFNAGVAARMDIQVERVTVEPDDALTVDEMTFDSVVEVTDADLTFAGFAMVALELRSSDQLTGVPRVSCDVDGYAGMRIWDGISSPSSPTFTTGFSRNPADMVLEVLTNQTWGMGSMYQDSDVDMASLFAWQAACAEQVDRPTSGTRLRFACDLAMSDARDGVDWLRAICSTGRAVPMTVGNRWAIAFDDTQTVPVERFTDGDIATDDNGIPRFEYEREMVTGGKHRPNQWLATIENGADRGLPDAIVYPQDGALWLATEPVNQQSMRFDGVTDPDQIASELVYIAKKTRGISRAVTFETVRDVVAVQPGDRFDLAVSLPGWGLASGRIQSGVGSTVTLDRSVTLAPATTYAIRVVHHDGSTDLRTISSSAGTYAAGASLTLSSALTQTAVANRATYSVGVSGAEMKPFVCTSVRLADPDRRIWEISGHEYAADVYDDTADEVELPEYSSLRDLTAPPGPVSGLTGREIAVEGGLRVELAWRQQPEDVALTGSFRIYRRVVGTVTWVPVPSPTVTNRGAVLEITDTDRAYDFVVVAVSLGGAALSPYDARHLRYTLVIGLAGEAPLAPGGIAATQTSGNTYSITWDDYGAGYTYAVLTGGDSTALPFAGAEDCMVVARPTVNELTGIELAPGQSITFWVRTVAPNQRMSAGAAVVTVSSPATPSGESIRATNGTKSFTLSSEGTLDNLTWATSRLEQVNTLEPGIWTSSEVDFGSAAVTELTFRPKTDNAAQDISIAAAPIVAPSIPADQWGIIDGSMTVGMMWPPWPDNEVTWLYELRTNDGSAWSDWETWAPLTSVRRTIRKYQVRVTMSRARAPYRPGLRGLIVVGTA